MIKLYGHPFSTCTRKVLTTLAETNTPFEMNVVDFAKGEHKQQPHLSRQPFGQVPAINDDGFSLYESRAIARYINEKVRGHLIPTDLQERAQMEQWMSVETSNFTPHAMKFIYQYVFQRPQPAEVLHAAGSALGNALDIMDARLSVSQYFAGNEFSLADICFMPYVGYLMGCPVKEQIASRTRVNAWWNRVSERPSWLKATGR